MEGKNLKVIFVMVTLILGMFAEKSTAGNETCYNLCRAQCGAGPTPLLCPFICLIQCGGRAESIDDKVTTSAHTYCKLGCAVMNCINKRTPQDLHEQELKDCYDFHCGKDCTK